MTAAACINRALHHEHKTNAHHLVGCLQHKKTITKQRLCQECPAWPEPCWYGMQISRLAMLSLLAVFKDILPGYRIRLPTEKELEIPVSKEVKQTRDYESMQLRLYQVAIALQFVSLFCHTHSVKPHCVKGSTAHFTMVSFRVCNRVYFKLYSLFCEVLPCQGQQRSNAHFMQSRFLLLKLMSLKRWGCNGTYLWQQESIIDLCCMLRCVTLNAIGLCLWAEHIVSYTHFLRSCRAGRRFKHLS